MEDESSSFFFLDPTTVQEAEQNLKRKYQFQSAFVEEQTKNTNTNENASISAQIDTKKPKIINPLLPFRLDTPEQIAEWIRQRRKNYPRSKEPISEPVHDPLGLLADYNSDMDSDDSEPETPVILSSKPGKPNIAKVNRRSTPKSFKNSLIGNPGSRSDSPLNSDTDSISSSSSDSDSDSASGSESVYESEVDLDLDAGSDASPPDVLPATRAPELQPNTSNIICKYFKLGRCNKGAKCRFLHPKDLVRTNKQKPTEMGTKKAQESKPLGLLEHLLQRDIKTENTRILQCLDYIYNKNFFSV